jgi:hypothetical protein
MARGSAINFAGYAYASAAQLVFVVLVTRQMPTHQAGLFFLAYAVLRVASAVGPHRVRRGGHPMGFASCRTRGDSGSRSRNHDRGATSVTLVASIGVAAAYRDTGVADLVVVSAPGIFSAGSHTGDGLCLSARSQLESVLMKASRATWATWERSALVDQILESSLRLSLVAIALAVTPTAASGGHRARCCGVRHAGPRVYGHTEAVWPAPQISTASVRSMWRFAVFQAGVVLTATCLLWIDTILIGIWRSTTEVCGLHGRH